MTVRLFRLGQTPCGVLLSLIVLLFCAGCESFQEIPFDDLALPEPDRSHLQEDEYRVKFQKSGDPAAARWLLAHRVKNAMPRKEVEKIFGQSGRFEPSDRTLKANSNAYRIGDKTYVFGPDSQGNSYHLVFRENRLVGFDPAEFRDDALE